MHCSSTEADRFLSHPSCEPRSGVFHHLCPREKYENACCTKSKQKRSAFHPATSAAPRLLRRFSSTGVIFPPPNPAATIPWHRFGRKRKPRAFHPATNPADSHIRTHPSAAARFSNRAAGAIAIPPSNTQLLANPATRPRCSGRSLTAANRVRESNKDAADQFAEARVCVARGGTRLPFPAQQEQANFF